MRDRVDEMRQWTIRGHLPGITPMTLTSQKMAADNTRKVASVFPGNKIEDWMFGDDWLIFNLD
jgi:hypothetical protein